jgi:acetyl-CoA carboxylase, biotin carboxylase subunit
MNTRIQVEHPVTELVAGVDLVQLQLRVAGGEALPFGQQDIALTGHAIECRITSEDPANGFLPSTGRIAHLHVPSGPGVRWDGAIGEGVEVSLYYDPLLAKLIVHGSDRPAAIQRMERALAELRVVGVDTCAGFHRRVMAEDDFRAGNVTIRYLDEHPELLNGAQDDEQLRVAAVAAALLEDESRTRRTARRRMTQANQPTSRWRDSGWR